MLVPNEQQKVEIDAIVKVLALTYKKEILDMIPDVVKSCCMTMNNPATNLEISTIDLDKVQELIPGLVHEKANTL